MRALLLTGLSLASLALPSCGGIAADTASARTPSREAALAYGAGGSHAPGSTGLGAGTQGPLSDPARVPPLAQGPGSRIGTTPQVPLSPQSAPAPSTQPCAALRGKERDRCLREAANAAASTPKAGGPGSVGMGSGAGTGTSTGTTGGASFGGSAPR